MTASTPPGDPGNATVLVADSAEPLTVVAIHASSSPVVHSARWTG
ncbi:hypothetical protein AB0E63_33125 [Kribbella sp. NPDC026596]